LRVVAADSSSAILNSRFAPVYIVATAAVVVDPPYREPTISMAEPIFADAKNGHEVIIREAELCKELLGKVKADIVHLDMSLGAVPLEQLSPIQFSDMRISNRAKRHLLKIFPKIRKVTGEITQKYGVEVLAIGKESIPVRIAELTSGAHAILYVCEKAVRENRDFLLGLPSKCQHKIAGGKVYLCSLMLAEHDIRGYAEDEKGVLKKVNITEMLNPIARGFRIIKIMPKR
jgi:hypothetical protein